MANLNPNTDGLIPFQKGQSGNPAGRPKKFLTIFKEQGYKTTEIVDTFNALLACEEDELAKVADDPRATILEKTVAAALLKGYMNKSLFNLELILNRTLGRPKETSEVKQDINVKAFKVAVVKVDTPFANNESDIHDGFTEEEMSEGI
jgi:hypothetical protein